MLNKKSSLHNYLYCKELIFIYLFLIFLGLKLHVFLFILGVLLLFFVIVFFRNNLNLDHVKKNDIISPSSSEIIVVSSLTTPTVSIPVNSNPVIKASPFLLFHFAERIR